MKVAVIVIVALCLLCALAHAEERKPVKKASFDTDAGTVNVFVDGDLSTQKLGPEPKSAKNYEPKKKSKSKDKKAKTKKRSKSDSSIEFGVKVGKGKKDKLDNFPYGGYMTFKAPRSSKKMYTVPPSAIQAPGSLGMETPQAPSKELCTDNCEAKKAQSFQVAGPYALTGVVGDLSNNFVRVPQTQTRAAPPPAMVWPLGQSCGCSVCPCPAAPVIHATACGCSSCPCSSGASFAAPAPPLAPLQSCGCSSCPCPRPTPPSPCGCEECPCPQVHHVPPVCGCAVCPCPKPTCGCSVCPCSGPLPFPHLLSPAVQQAIARATSTPVNTVGSATVTPATPCTNANGCPVTSESPAMRALRAKELAEEKIQAERDQKRRELHEEMFKHEANFNAISRLSRQLRFEFAQLRHANQDLRARIRLNQQSLTQLQTTSDDFDIDTPANATAIHKRLKRDHTSQHRLLIKSLSSQEKAICTFLKLDDKACQSRAKALAQVSSAAKKAGPKKAPRFKEVHHRKRA